MKKLELFKGVYKLLAGVCTFVKVLQGRNSNADLPKVFNLALNLAVHFGQANIVGLSLCINELFKLIPES